MENQDTAKHSKPFSWFDDPSEPESAKNLHFNSNSSFPQMEILIQNQAQISDPGLSTRTPIHCNLSPESTSLPFSYPISPIKIWKGMNKNQLCEDMQPGHRNTKDEKQNLYSRAYRERKKQRLKILEDESEFLKKRIQELEYKLRQQQIELNRFKFPPPEKQLTLQELRREFLERTVLVLNEHKAIPDEQTKRVYTPKDPFYHEFLDIYAERGFAGSRKTKLLNYHFNEILEAMVKDSERYLSLMFANSDSWDDLRPLEGFEMLHAAFYDVFKLDEDSKQRLMYFVRHLHPLHMELTKHTSAFYKSFHSILDTSQNIHNFIQETYLSSMDFARKRIELQTWFQFHKYSKSMRKLRFQWLQLVKQGVHEDQKDVKKNLRGTKKKKMPKEVE